jgi:hypothetical protein
MEGGFEARPCKANESHVLFCRIAAISVRSLSPRLR